MPEQEPNEIEWRVFEVPVSYPPGPEDPPNQPPGNQLYTDLEARLQEVSTLGYMVLTVTPSPLWSGGWIIAYRHPPP